jgi:hypothetical protein
MLASSTHHANLMIVTVAGGRLGGLVACGRSDMDNRVATSAGLSAAAVQIAVEVRPAQALIVREHG